MYHILNDEEYKKLILGQNTFNVVKELEELKKETTMLNSYEHNFSTQDTVMIYERLCTCIDNILVKYKESLGGVYP